MTPERWQDVERLFHGALELPLDERASFLRESSAGDDALKREVESLLQQHHLAGTFLEGRGFLRTFRSSRSY
jgi:eukaryotic-like serine/threonine-protein kinase